MSVLGLRHQPCGSDGPRLGAPNGYAPLTLNLFPPESRRLFLPRPKRSPGDWPDRRVKDQSPSLAEGSKNQVVRHYSSRRLQHPESSKTHFPE